MFMPIFFSYYFLHCSSTFLCLRCVSSIGSSQFFCHGNLLLLSEGWKITHLKQRVTEGVWHVHLCEVFFNPNPEFSAENLLVKAGYTQTHAH